MTDQTHYNTREFDYPYADLVQRVSTLEENSDGRHFVSRLLAGIVGGAGFALGIATTIVMNACGG